jgi:acylphosphatase
MNAVITIQGVVQGVGYRFYVIEQARHYMVKGYVKNLENGCVEVVAEGPKGLLNEFINRLSKGPKTAHVTGVDIQWNEKNQGYSDFSVRV